MLTDFNELFIHSGNILQIHAIKSKTGITPTDELVDCLQTAISNGRTICGSKTLEIYNFTDGEEIVEAKELLTNVKVFLKIPTVATLKAAVDSVKTVLYNLSIDSLIIWYPEQMTDEPSDGLLELWNVMGEFVMQKKVCRLGIADIDTKIFISLYNKVTIKPAIFHLTVQNCCLVPPDLQKFAEENGIQLLTHYDPADILPDEKLFGELKNFKPQWIARYHSHIRCRGVLAKKGYLAYFRQI